MGILFGGLGVAILAALVRLPESLDALLLVSHALANVIGGLSRLGLGLLQLATVLAVVLLALLALLLLAGSAVRLWRAVVPRAESGEVAPRRSPPPLL